MSKNSKTVTHPGYEEMQDTPWITQARDIASAGGQGILDNYKNVDYFDSDTLKSLSDRNDEVYQRALDDFDRNYAQTMNAYNARNYNQFGTLNSTPAAYRTDMENLSQQRKLADLSYNKAMNYENLINNELNRRYNTLNMYSNMYNYGQTPYQQDLMNWNTRNTNRDISYNNALTLAANSGNNNWISPVLSTVGTIGGGMIGGPLGATIGSSIGRTAGSFFS